SVTIQYYTIHEQDLEKVALFLKSFNSLKHLAPVYIDETGFDTYFYRKYGCSLKGQLIRGKVSGRIYQRISLVAGLTNGELIAPMTYAETMTSDFFEAWFQKFLLPTLNTPSVIIMDNARFRRMGKLEVLCEEFGNKLLPLLPYSPEYNPIEKTWAHIKKHLKRVLPSCNTFYEALLSHSCKCLR
ncbi:transposase, partial [Streptococcus pneumoniae]